MYEKNSALSKQVNYIDENMGGGRFNIADLEWPIKYSRFRIGDSEYVDSV